MERSIGQQTETTTNTQTTNHSGGHATRESDAPDDVAAPPPTPDADADVHRRLRDLPPSSIGDDTGIIDLDAVQRAVDPLDERRPGRPTNDPLNPEAHLN